MTKTNKEQPVLVKFSKDTNGNPIFEVLYRDNSTLQFRRNKLERFAKSLQENRRGKPYETFTVKSDL